MRSLAIVAMMVLVSGEDRKNKHPVKQKPALGTVTSAKPCPTSVTSQSEPAFGGEHGERAPVGQPWGHAGVGPCRGLIYQPRGYTRGWRRARVDGGMSKMAG